MSLTDPDSPTLDVPSWVTHDGTRFRAITYEAPVDAPLETVWAELHDGYTRVEEIHTPIRASFGLPGEPETGLGAVRHCDLDFKGRDVAIKERIIDLVEGPDHKEYTYDVYESKGFPARVFNTWRVRRGPAGETLLANVFFYRMRPAVLTRPMAGQIRGAARGSVLAFKHYLETGERKVPPGEIQRRYATL